MPADAAFSARAARDALGLTGVLRGAKDFVLPKNPLLSCICASMLLPDRDLGTAKFRTNHIKIGDVRNHICSESQARLQLLPAVPAIYNSKLLLELKKLYRY